MQLAAEVLEEQRTQVDRLERRIDAVESSVISNTGGGLSFYRLEPIRRVEVDFRTINAVRHGDTVYLQARLSSVMGHVPWWCYRSSVTSPAGNTDYVSFVEGELTVAGAQETITVDDTEIYGVNFTGANWTTAVSITKASRFYMELDFVAKTWTFKELESSDDAETLPAWPESGSGKIIYRLASVNWNNTRHIVTTIQNHNVGAIQIPG